MNITRVLPAHTHYRKLHWALTLGLVFGAMSAKADLTDLSGSFFIQLEELSAKSNQATYTQLQSSGCTDSQRNPTAGCGGITFISWQAVRELVHTANDLGGSGPSEFTLGTDLEGLGFALRWTAGEEFSAEGNMSNSFVGGQLSGLASRISSLRYGGSGVAFNQQDNVGILIASNYLNGETGGGASVDSQYQWSPWGSFLNASYVYGDRGATELEDAFDFDGIDVNGGFDYRLTSNQVIGLMLGVQTKEVDFDSSQSIVDGKVEMDGFSIQPFYLYQTDDWYFSASLGYQMMQFNMERRISYPSINPNVAPTNTVAVSENDASGISSSFTFGYSWYPSPAFALEPYISLDYRNIEVDGFTENDVNNDGFDFVVEKQEIDSLETALGFKMHYVLTPSFGVFVPYVDVQLRVQYEDDPTEIKAYYFSASEALTDINAASFILPSDDPDTSYQIYTLGLSMVLQGAYEAEDNNVASGGVSAFVNYRTFVGIEHYSQSQIAGGIRYEF
jgi:uncharacterized protein YhjY with autotransporter beta-barrel domain